MAEQEDDLFAGEDGFESDRSVDNSLVGPLDSGDDSDDDDSGAEESRSGRTAEPAHRGRHFAEWTDRELDVRTEPFSGNRGYRGANLGGVGAAGAAGAADQPRHVEPIAVWRQFFTDELIACLVIETNRYAQLCAGRSTFTYKKQRKPTGDGMKLTGIAESKSGYVFCFELDRRNKKKIEDFVLDNCAKLDPVFHHVYFDNLFTSVALFKTLFERKVYACGTIRSNRGLPAELTEKACKFPRPGLWKFRMAPPQLPTVAWKDTGHTTILSNFHKPEQEVILRRERGKRERQHRLAPTSAADYNKFMGAVDRADSLRSSYTAQMTSRKWWHPLFYFCLDVAMVNAFIVHQHLTRTTQSHLSFTESVCQALVGGYADPDMPVPHAKRVRVNPQQPPPARTVGNHWPMKSSKGRCVECYSQGRKTKYSRMSCEQCGVHLHPECFKTWHLK